MYQFQALILPNWNVWGKLLHIRASGRSAGSHRFAEVTQPFHVGWLDSKRGERGVVTDAVIIVIS